MRACVCMRACVHACAHTLCVYTYFVSLYIYICLLICIVLNQTPTNRSAILPPSANIDNTALAISSPLPEMPILAKGVKEIMIHQEIFTVQSSFRLLCL